MYEKILACAAMCKASYIQWSILHHSKNTVTLESLFISVCRLTEAGFNAGIFDSSCVGHRSAAALFSCTGICLSSVSFVLSLAARACRCLIGVVGLAPSEGARTGALDEHPCRSHVSASDRVRILSFSNVAYQYVIDSGDSTTSVETLHAQCRLSYLWPNSCSDWPCTERCVLCLHSENLSGFVWGYVEKQSVRSSP